VRQYETFKIVSCSTGALVFDRRIASAEGSGNGTPVGGESIDTRTVPHRNQLRHVKAFDGRAIKPAEPQLQRISSPYR